MTDLVDEIKQSFTVSRDERFKPGQVQRLTASDVAPGFVGMRELYSELLLVYTRRGYRWFAGSSMPSQADDLLELTRPVMLPDYVALMVRAFSNGAVIGQGNEQVVKMLLFYGKADELFGNEEYRIQCSQFAKGLASDPEVLDFFTMYLNEGLDQLLHLVGIAHTETEPNQIWNFWLLVGTAVISTSYLAGFKLGKDWSERDLLDGIESATEEASRGSEGEAGSDH